MKLLTLSLIAIYTSLLCYASDPRIVFFNCFESECDFARKVLLNARDHMVKTHELIEKNQKNYPLQQIAQVYDYGGLAYSTVHFHNPANIITLSGDMPRVGKLQANTLHISCARETEKFEPLIEKIPEVENAEYLQLPADFFPNFSADKGKLADKSDQDTILINEEVDRDVTSYREAFQAKNVANTLFFKFLMPTSRVSTIIKVIQTSELVMGEHVMKCRKSTPIGGLAMTFLKIPGSRDYAEGPALISFVAHAEPEVFDESLYDRNMKPPNRRGSIVTKGEFEKHREKVKQGVAEAFKESAKTSKKAAKPKPKPKKKPKKKDDKTPEPSSSSSSSSPPSPPPHASSSRVRRRLQKARF